MSNINLGNQSPQLNRQKHAGSIKNKQKSPPVQSSLKVPQDSITNWSNTLLPEGANSADSKGAGDTISPLNIAPDSLTQNNSDLGNTNTDNLAPPPLGEDKDIVQYNYNAQGNNTAYYEGRPFQKIKQSSVGGTNMAYGTNVDQGGINIDPSITANNIAKGTGKGSHIKQYTSFGDNTATNAQNINQTSDNGKNMATGTAGSDTIVQKGSNNTVDAGAGDDNITQTGAGTANGGTGDDFISVQGAGTHTVDGGDGSDTLVLSHTEGSWLKETKGDGQMVYTNTISGDTVIAKNIENVILDDGSPLNATDANQGGDNNAPEGFTSQSTAKGNNTGATQNGTQFTQDGDNTASALDDHSSVNQKTLHGNNSTTGDTVFQTLNQHTDAGMNTGSGGTVTQTNGQGDNTASGDDVTQTSDHGNNTATSYKSTQHATDGNNTTQATEEAIQTNQSGNNTANSNDIMQYNSNGTNSATGTDGDDIIRQAGNSTANAGAGDDIIVVGFTQQFGYGPVTGPKTYTVDGGDGNDTLYLPKYAEGGDADTAWTKEDNGDGQVTYKNSVTGDTVIAKNIEEVDINNPDAKNLTNGLGLPISLP